MRKLESQYVTLAIALRLPTQQPSKTQLHSKPHSTHSVSLSEIQVRVITFCRPGNLNLALLKASMAAALFPSLVLTDMMTWPMLTRATVPWGLPNAPRIPV